MQKRPTEFSSLLVAMVRIGEESGSLAEALEKLATTLEEDRRFRKRLSGALAYPSIVTAFSVGVMTMLLMTVVPVFQNMYEQLHVRIPTLLHVLIATGKGLRSPAPAIVVFLVLPAAALLVCYWRPRAVERTVDHVRLHLPILSIIYRKSSTARLCRTLGMLLGSGISMERALPTVAEALSAGRFRDSIHHLRNALAQGQSITESMSALGLYDGFFLQLVRIGEETGSLDFMLARAAADYEFEVDMTLQTLSSVLEPIMIVVLGGAVAFIAAAVFLPLYTLIGNIQ